MNIGSVRWKTLNCLKGALSPYMPLSGVVGGMHVRHSTKSAHRLEKNEIGDYELIDDDAKLEPQCVDPMKGWDFRGVYRAIICGKVGQVPIQKILRNGKTVTIFTVGTGGMFDQRIVGGEHLPRPAQWHRIAVHNDQLGTFAVQQLVKDTAVYVEGDIETRVYNDSITGQVKNVPEICLRNDGKIRLMRSGNNATRIALDNMRDLL